MRARRMGHQLHESRGHGHAGDAARGRRSQNRWHLRYADRAVRRSRARARMPAVTTARSTTSASTTWAGFAGSCGRARRSWSRRGTTREMLTRSTAGRSSPPPISRLFASCQPSTSTTTRFPSVRSPTLAPPARARARGRQRADRRALRRARRQVRTDPVRVYEQYLAERPRSYMQIESGQPAPNPPSPWAELTGYDRIAFDVIAAIVNDTGE